MSNENTVPVITDLPTVASEPAPKNSRNWKKIRNRVAVATGVVVTGVLATSIVRKFRKDDSGNFETVGDVETSTSEA
jgi:hypothetical protein